MEEYITRGSIKWQVSEIYHKSGINQIGTSKHTAKAVARQDGARTWHQIGHKLGIYSYKTANAYRSIWGQIATHVRSEFGQKDMEKLTGEHMQSFLQSKIEAGVAHATYQRYSAACQKLESALNKFADQKGTGQTYDFQSAISSANKIGGTLQRFEGSRAYAQPGRLIAHLQTPAHQIAAKIQHEGGARVRETARIRVDQLRPGNIIHLDRVGAKGGKERDIHVSADTYQQLRNHIQKHGAFEINHDTYRQDLKQAAKQTNQEYTGSHGLRWNYAQERMTEVQRKGETYEQGLTRVSGEMGHIRADITEHYLR